MLSLSNLLRAAYTIGWHPPSSLTCPQVRPGSGPHSPQDRRATTSILTAQTKAVSGPGSRDTRPGNLRGTQGTCYINTPTGRAQVQPTLELPLPWVWTLMTLPSKICFQRSQSGGYYHTTPHHCPEGRARPDEESWRARPAPTSGLRDPLTCALCPSYLYSQVKAASSKRFRTSLTPRVGWANIGFRGTPGRGGESEFR